MEMLMDVLDPAASGGEGDEVNWGREALKGREPGVSVKALLQPRPAARRSGGGPGMSSREMEPHWGHGDWGGAKTDEQA